MAFFYLIITGKDGFSESSTTPPGVNLRPALFLDRDGVVIHDSGYVKSAQNVRLLPGIADLILRARQAQWKVVIVTNQSGLGRGWITPEEYQAVSSRMLELLSEKQATVDRIYFAPFYEPEAPGPHFLQNPTFHHHGVQEVGRWDKGWRKPMPGMIWQAAADLDIETDRSILVGDRATDQVCGFLSGLARTYFLKSDILENEQKELETWRGRIESLTNEAKAWRNARPNLQAVALSSDKPQNLHSQPVVIESFAEVRIQ